MEKIFTRKKSIKINALEEGTFFARDLVSEPGNILHPDEYVRRWNFLKDGLKEIYDKKIKKLGMNALLGVGMGSIRDHICYSWVEWCKNNSKPLLSLEKELLLIQADTR